jgi:hypothetical protein
LQIRGIITVFIDNNYPKNLITALQLIHQIQIPMEFNIQRTQQFDEMEHPVVFLFDKGKKGLDIVTEKHFESGFRIFAFKFYAAKKLYIFQLSPNISSFWPAMLNIIKQETSPFVFTYGYSRKSLKK